MIIDNPFNQESLPFSVTKYLKIALVSQCNFNHVYINGLKNGRFFSLF